MNEIIEKQFNGSLVPFHKIEDNICLTAETIGGVLEYNNPRKDIMQLYYRHKDELEEYTSILNLSTEAGLRETTVFEEEGIYIIIMLSHQPKAITFRKWVSKIIKDLRTKNPIELMSDSIIYNNKKIKMLFKSIMRIENRFDVSPINDTQCGIISTLVKKIAIEKGLTTQGIYWHFDKNFEIAEYKKLPQIKFGSALSYLNSFLPENQWYTLKRYNQKTLTMFDDDWCE